MKVLAKSIFVILSLMSLSPRVFSSSKDVLPQNNFCSPMIDSKKYLSNDFSLVYPRKAQFECSY